MSRQIDFGKKPEYLVGLLIAAGRCGSHSLGFEPAFVSDDQYPCEVEEFNVQGLSCPRYPTQSDVTSSRRLPNKSAPKKLANFKVVGKSLTIRPRLKALPPGAIPKPRDECFCPPRSLFGRNTSVYEVVAKRGSLNTGAGKLVGKFSWDLTSHVSEADILRIANEAGVSNIPELIAYGVVAEQEENSAWTRLLCAAFAKKLDPRIDSCQLRVTVIPKYQPLVLVRTLKTFISAFLSIIQGTPVCGSIQHSSPTNLHVELGHRDLHYKANILHGDICPDNLMVDLKDNSRGVLIDFNNAIRVGENDRDRIGHLSVGHKCMALELLVAKNRPRHDYKHDLESFLWSFLDIVFNYRHEDRIQRPEPHNNTNWGESRLQDKKNAKIMSLKDMGTSHNRLVSVFCEELGSEDNRSNNALNNFILRWSKSVHDEKPLQYNDVVGGLQHAISRFR